MEHTAYIKHTIIQIQNTEKKNYTTEQKQFLELLTEISTGTGEYATLLRNTVTAIILEVNS